VIAKLFLTIPHGWLAGLLAVRPLCCWTGGMGVCASLVRTDSKSLARVLTSIALDLSLCLSLAMHAAMPFVCMLLPLSVCMGVAESSIAADWPQVCCVSYVI
jgi:hypothetical protein